MRLRSVAFVAVITAVALNLAVQRAHGHALSADRHRQQLHAAADTDADVDAAVAVDAVAHAQAVARIVARATAGPTESVCVHVLKCAYANKRCDAACVIKASERLAAEPNGGGAGPGPRYRQSGKTKSVPSRGDFGAGNAAKVHVDGVPVGGTHPAWSKEVADTIKAHESQTQAKPKALLEMTHQKLRHSRSQRTRRAEAQAAIHAHLRTGAAIAPGWRTATAISFSWEAEATIDPAHWDAVGNANAAAIAFLLHWYRPGCIPPAGAAAWAGTNLAGRRAIAAALYRKAPGDAGGNAIRTALQLLGGVANTYRQECQDAVANLVPPRYDFDQWVLNEDANPTLRYPGGDDDFTLFTNGASTGKVPGYEGSFFSFFNNDVGTTKRQGTVALMTNARKALYQEGNAETYEAMSNGGLENVADMKLAIATLNGIGKSPQAHVVYPLTGTRNGQTGGEATVQNVAFAGIRQQTTALWAYLNDAVAPDVYYGIDMTQGGALAAATQLCNARLRNMWWGTLTSTDLDAAYAHLAANDVPTNAFEWQCPDLDCRVSASKFCFVGYRHGIYNNPDALERMGYELRVLVSSGALLEAVANTVNLIGQGTPYVTLPGHLKRSVNRVLASHDTANPTAATRILDETSFTSFTARLTAAGSLIGVRNAWDADALSFNQLLGKAVASTARHPDFWPNNNLLVNMAQGCTLQHQRTAWYAQNHGATNVGGSTMQGQCIHHLRYFTARFAQCFRSGIDALSIYDGATEKAVRGPQHLAFLEGLATILHNAMATAYGGGGVATTRPAINGMLTDLDAHRAWGDGVIAWLYGHVAGPACNAFDEFIKERTNYAA